MKRFKKFLNHFVPRVLGTIIFGLGVFLKLRYGKEGFNGTDLFLITVSIPLGIIFFSYSLTEIIGYIREKFLKLINNLKNIFFDDDYEDDEYRDFDDACDFHFEVDESDYEEEDD